MHIEKYTIKELQSYAKSADYLKGDIIPISPERIASYISNPRAVSDKAVLFLLKEGDELIAYRTLLPDWMYSSSEKISFAWLSGNYVLPQHRRKGYSSTLFNAVQEEWDGQLMYTNYAPASKAVYDQTGNFQDFHTVQGRRFYFKGFTTSLLKERVSSKNTLRFIDHTINIYQDLRLNNFSFTIPENIDIQEIDQIDKELEALFSKNQTKSLFQRTEVEFDWIQRQPWLVEQSEAKSIGTYHFSRSVEQFESKWYSINYKDSKAFLWITIVNEKLSIPYFFYENTMQILAAKKIILDAMFKYNCAYLTTNNKELQGILKKKPFPFVLSKSMPQKYFAHLKLLAKIPENPVLSDGDGDSVFS